VLAKQVLEEAQGTAAEDGREDLAEVACQCEVERAAGQETEEVGQSLGVFHETTEEDGGIASQHFTGDERILVAALLICICWRLFND
jgi:hypothetical protein